jgi:hypothetical protein
LVKVRPEELGGDEKTLVEVLDEKNVEMYCLLRVLREKGAEMFAWTLGDEEWQREKFIRSGASKFIDDEHLYVAEIEKITKLREILDKILSDRDQKPIYVYVVDDNPKRINEAMALREEYGKKGIELRDYNLKISDPQADGTAFCKWITRKIEENPNSVLVLDFDQVIANTDEALFGSGSVNILRQRLEARVSVDSTTENGPIAA